MATPLRQEVAVRGAGRASGGADVSFMNKEMKVTLNPGALRVLFLLRLLGWVTL